MAESACLKSVCFCAIPSLQDCTSKCLRRWEKSSHIVQFVERLANFDLRGCVIITQSQNSKFSSFVLAGWALTKQSTKYRWGEGGELRVGYVSLTIAGSWQNLKLNLLVKHLPPEILLSAIDMRRIATRFSENFSELTTPVRLKLLSLK